MYQDADGNWLPEAKAILAKATAIQATSNGQHILLPMNEVEVRAECPPQEIEKEVETP
jgi:hypothetical protein